METTIHHVGFSVEGLVAGGLRKYTENPHKPQNNLSHPVVNLFAGVSGTWK